MAQKFSPKYPWEEYYVDFDYSSVLGLEELESATIVVTDPDDADVTSTLTDVTKQVINGVKVYVWMQAGTTTKTYTVNCQVVGLADSQYELEGTITIK